MSDESNQNITISDQASAKDSLGLTPYVIAMAEFLTHPDTKPPLTISIEGEWGSGKSSFMKQLEEQIKVKSEELKKEKLNKLKSRHSRWWYSLELKFGQKTQTVWFNAWRHDKAESLWATFALSFLEEISRNRDLSDFTPNLLSSFQLFLKRLDFKGKPIKAVQIIFSGLIISSIILVIIAAIIDVTFLRGGFSRVYTQYLNVVNIIAPVKNEEAKKTDNKDSDNSPKGKQPATTDNKDLDPLLSLSLLFGGTGGSLVGVGKLLSKLKELIGDPKTDLTKYLESPDYKSQVAFVEKFHEDFRKIVEAYIGVDEKVYVFIDDLDRCELSKAADLLQALNMMISNDPQIIFILGMDREKVAAGITYKQKDVLPYLASIAGKNQDTKDTDTLRKQVDYGFSYLEKFVQLSFTLPKPSENSLNNFFEGLATTDKEEETSEKSFFMTPTLSNLNFLFNYVKIKLFLDKSVIKELVVNKLSKIIILAILIHPELHQLALLLVKESQKTKPKLEKNVEKPIFPILKKDLDKNEKEDLVKMVAPFFDNNPRRLKQYINALRLKRYMYYYAIGVNWNEKEQITQQQLGKFIAITLKHPRLLYELEKPDKKDHHLLNQLEQCAIDKFNPANTVEDSQNNEVEQAKPKDVNYGDANYWVNTYPKLAELLRYGVTTDPEKYSLKNEGIKKLLEVSPKLELDSKYFKLREFLEANNWKEADEETLNVMLKVANREKQGYLDVGDIEDFPCKELHIIDQLWVKYSNGYFGFSVQKKIYTDRLHGAREYNREIWEEFGDIVGWYNKSEGEWLSYDQLNFTYAPTPDTTTDTDTIKEVQVKQSSTTSSKAGHLPSIIGEIRYLYV